jgi:hypothetical protein
MWLFWLIIVLSITFSIGIRLYNSPKAKGTRLENKIHQRLEKLALKYEGFAFKDLMLPIGDSTSQIDNVLITPKAMFVIEAKNYKGRIFGSINQDQWTLTSKTTKTYKNKRGKSYQKSFINKYQFYNPVKQNETHVNAIRNLLKTKIKIHNLIVFGSMSDISAIESFESMQLTKIFHLSSLIDKEIKSTKEYIEKEELIIIAKTITDKNILNKKLRKNHIKKIKKKYKN